MEPMEILTASTTILVKVYKLDLLTVVLFTHVLTASSSLLFVCLETCPHSLTFAMIFIFFHNLMLCKTVIADVMHCELPIYIDVY